MMACIGGSGSTNYVARFCQRENGTSAKHAPYLFVVHVARLLVLDVGVGPVRLDFEALIGGGARHGVVVALFEEAPLFEQNRAFVFALHGM